MLTGLPLWEQILLSAVAVALAAGSLALLLLGLPRWWGPRRPPVQDRAPAHVCGHCGRILITGSLPPIISACGPEVQDCTRPRR